ncbi:MAG: SusC/RagA family TonB-linked outer membrane protein, partial [Bacteroidota bacterium]|nr:SusC/RagA family TonB-linked outer membrane protein [Bacteroidota bacterium]
MKLVTLFLFVAVMHVAAASYSQTTKLTIVGQNLSVGEILDRIEKQSNFSFFFNANQIDLNKRMSISADNQLVTKILDGILEGSGLTYTVNNKLIVIHKAGETLDVLSSQQTTKVTGKITDSSGGPLPGVSIVIKGTTNGTITDANGNFSLTNIPEEAIIQISFVGMKPLEVSVAGKSTLTITMTEDAIGIDEVVAIGYGVQKKKLVTGATIQIKGSDILKQNTANALGALQSRAPGVDITQTSGQPGSGYKVTIRGVGTTGNSSPLYVVDGIVRSGINDLDPSSIASMDVLKDAASAAIYGARAANGVILITTKQGLDSKPTLTYDGYFGFSNVYKPLKTLNAQEYTQIMNEAAANSGLNPFNYASLVPNWESFENGTNRGVDWLGEALIHNAPTQRHSVNLRGGSSTAIYATGFSKFTEEGTIGNPVNPKYNRSTFYINSEVNVIKNSQNRTLLKIGENLSYAYYTQNGINVGNQGGSNVRNLLNENPFQPNGKNEDGTYIIGIPWDPIGANPIAKMVLMQGMNNNKHHSVNGNAYIVIEPMKDLTIRSTYGINVGANMSNRFTPTY